MCWFSCSVLLTLLVTIVALVYYYLHNVYSYFQRLGIPGPTPIWLLGNMSPRLRPTLSLSEFDQMLYQKHGGNKLCGFYEFQTPALMIGDPDLLKHVMVRDFEHFTDRSLASFNEPVMDHMLLGLKGPMWKSVRSFMTPIFSSGKIKQTLSLVKDCAKNLHTYFTKQVESGHPVFEMKQVYGSFTMDTIASIAFGINSNSLNNTQDEFSMAAAKFFRPPSVWQRPLVYLASRLPHVCKLLRLDPLHRNPIHFFTKVVSDTMKYRLEHGLRRSDFLQLLLDAFVHQQQNNKKPQEEVLNELVITAQCVLFYIAGYDTTATTLSFVSYCLALHPTIQQRVIEEVENVMDRHGGEITFDAIQECTYMDMVFAETLRLYPPAPRVDRTCTKDYTLPGTDITIPKGQKIIIPIYSIHHDPRNYPEPEKFNPERFSSENKKQRSPILYLPFGAGPRNCIGGRFALMEAKVALMLLLQDFAFIPSKRTQIPIVIEKHSGLLKAQDGVWVRMAKRAACEE